MDQNDKLRCSKVFRFLALAVALILITAACGSRDTVEETAPAATQAPLASVKVMLGLMPQVQYAGIHTADAQSLYQNENLDVELVYSEPRQSIGAAVLAGEVQFGPLSAGELLQARARGEPLVAVMTIYQRDSTAVISLKSKDIQQPSDLAGKKVLVWGNELSFKLFIRAVRVDPDQVTLVYPESDDILQAAALFLTGEVDAMVGPGTDIAVQLDSIGIHTNAIFLEDYGIANYLNVIVTTEQMIQEQPDVVQRFVRATLDGLQYTVEQPQAAAALFVEHYRDQLFPQQVIPGAQEKALLALLPLMQPAGTQLGAMSPETWQYVYDGMTALRLLDPQVDLSQAYTLQFVEDYYNPSQ